jgi:DNA ligase 1
MTFYQLAQYFDRLEKESSRLVMTEILSELFRAATPNEIGPICYLVTGRVAPKFEAVEFGLADKFLIRAIAHLSNKSPEEILAVFKKVGDLGDVAYQFGKEEGKSITVHDVFEQLTKLTTITGTGSQDEKITAFESLLSSVDRLSARYLIRIPLGKLRLGFSDMTILDALSWMLTNDKSGRERLEEAFNVRPDLGLIATQVKKEGLNGLGNVHAVVGAPILSALCQRVPTADEMIEKMGEVSVEPKYDGVRVQIHYRKKDGTVKITSYSRNLEETTEMFPELYDSTHQLTVDDIVLDSEAVGVDAKTGKIMSFQETTTRKRKHGIQLALAEVPLLFYVFDILVLNGKDLLSVPLCKRRTLLEETVKNEHGPLRVAPHIVTNSALVLREYHEKQRKAGLEGVVVKKWNGPYEPGRRGFSWVKFKEEEGHQGKLTDTIDAVVMGYYYGEGKRKGFGIGAFLVGVRDEDGFVTVTKIGTGVTDDLWRELKTRLEPLIVKNQPKEYKNVDKLLIPDVWVTPTMVVELAGDDLTRSPNHGAGYAVRFPRLVKIRDDKSPQEATTIREIGKMFDNQ